MKRICAWCKQVMGEKEGQGETHTICDACRGKFFEESISDQFAMAELTNNLDGIIESIGIRYPTCLPGCKVGNTDLDRCRELCPEKF